MNKKAWALVAAAAALLAACGGGDSPPSNEQVPATANASIDGFISYVQSLVASSSDMLEPVDVSAVVPPKDETSAPASVD